MQRGLSIVPRTYSDLIARIDMAAPCYKFIQQQGPLVGGDYTLTIAIDGNNLPPPFAGVWKSLGLFHRPSTPEGEMEAVYDELDKNGFVVVPFTTVVE